MTVLYSLALFVSAALLFLLEPMVGKFVLPLLGSAPEVWPTTVLFFQAALLAGYGFAHLSSRLAPRRQALIQLGVLALAVAALPIAVPHASPPHSEHPIPWLVALLATTAGPPFFALAVLGPMLQRWLAGTQHPAAHDPYFLFAASNGGSLLGLLAYPLVLEPQLSLGGQGTAWTVGYAVAAVLVVASAGALWRQRRVPAASVSARGPSIGWRRRLSWLALAAVPSSLVLGTTTYLTRDVSPVPLLWVVPLAIYLATFVVAFSPWTNAERLTTMGRRALPLAAILVTYTLVVRAQSPLAALLLLHLAGLACAGLLCHGRLAADRPPAGRLTEFYLWVALGGALGGAFNAVLSPLVFPGLVEYPLAIVAACLLRPAPPKTRPDLLEFFLDDPRPTRWMDVVVPILLGTAVAVAFAASGQSRPTQSALAGMACGLSLSLSRRPLRFGLAIGAIFLASLVISAQGGRVLDRERSFFGIYRVVASEHGTLHELYSGTTLHGAERMQGSRPGVLSYYGRAGPAGQAFAALPASTTQRVAAVGLGAGSLACLQRPGSQLTFFEIDPAVVRIARNPRHFTFLSHCPVRPAVIIGDGRRALAREPPGRFGLVVIDAFNSDAIPLHLITRQAIEVYRSRTTPRGALLFHLSNRYLDLEPVVGNIAAALHLTCRHRRYTPAKAQRDRGETRSRWALLAGGPGDLGPIAADRRWKPCAVDRSARTWTDDYSSPLGVIDWG